MDDLNKSFDYKTRFLTTLKNVVYSSYLATHSPPPIFGILKNFKKYLENLWSP